MKAFRRLINRLWGTLVGRGHDADLADEFELHIEMQTADNVRAGMTPEEARRTAVLKFGAVEATKEAYRDQRALPLFENICADLRFTFRMLAKNRGFAVVAVLTLALGIGVNTAVFSVTNGVLFKGFRLVDRNDRILYIDTPKNGVGCCVSYPDFQDWRAEATSFRVMAVYHSVGVTFGDPNGRPESLPGAEVSADAFKVLGQKPLIGRDFNSSDETPGSPPVVILEYGLWERRYARDPEIVGQTVEINGIPTTVIGVMPQGFSFAEGLNLWIPVVQTPDRQRRGDRNLWFAFGRLADGVTGESATAELAAIGGRLSDAYPRTNNGFAPVPRRFADFFIGRSAPTIYGSLWGAVGFVLLIACANLANLMLARAVTRSREISLRIAIGAGRRQIVRQLLVESLTLSAMGGMIGWWIADLGIRAYELGSRLPSHTPPKWDYSMDHRVLFYLVIVSLGAGLLSGLVPALRLSKLDIHTTLKDGGFGTSSGKAGKHWIACLVTAEVALAVLLIAGAAVMMRSFLRILTSDVGVRTANVLTVQLDLPTIRYREPDRQILFFDTLRKRLEAVPGVESVAIASSIPTYGTRRLPYQIAGSPAADRLDSATVSSLIIGPSYFQTLGARVVLGREFNNVDGSSGLPVVVVNQQFANKHWPGEDALGKSVTLLSGQPGETLRTVIGVVSNISQNDAGRGRQEFDPLIYLPYRQGPISSMYVIARTGIPAGNLASAVRNEIQTLDSDLLIFGPFTLDDKIASGGYYWSNATYAVVFLVFASIALMLASIGIYAAVAYSVSQRQREIGVRIAIGATASDIFGLVFRKGMLPAGIGLAIGLVASLEVNPVLKSMLVQVSPTDPMSLLIASVVLVSSAALGCWVPARRAVRVDPLVALRHE